MKKIWMIVLVGLLMTGFSSLAVTEENKGDMMDMMTKQLKEFGKMYQEKMKGTGDVCEMMMGKSLVATPDGGVVVWLGNKLFKYDKNLVLQKEGEIKIDMEGMQKMMEKCQMSGKIKNEGKSTGETK
jgi:hypothetical protein